MTVIKSKTKAKLLIRILALLAFLSSSCSTRLNEKIQGVQFYYSLPFIKNDGQIFIMSDSVNIIYYKKFVLLEIPYKVEYSNVVWNSEGNSKETLIKEELRHRYFIYEDSQLYGLKYDSLNANTSQKILVDTFLKQTIFGNMVFYNKKNDSLIATHKLTESIILEKYIPKVKYDASYGDSLYFYFNNGFRNLKYSLSKELDSIKRTKLFKVVSIYNTEYDTLSKIKKPKTSFIFGIKPIVINDLKAKAEFCKIFERDIENSKN